MISEFLFVILGICAGTFTGLVPGIHANTLCAAMLFLPIEPSLSVAGFIVAMNITHSFVDAIPNILLGIPSEDGFLSILPGHRMLLLGRGLDAVRLTILGGITTSIFALAMVPLVFPAALRFGDWISACVPAIIFLVLAGMVASEKEKITAVAAILLSGAAGMLFLNAGIPNAVFAMVSGFFGIPGLVYATLSKAGVPEQKCKEGAEAEAQWGFGSAVASMATGIVPSIGPSHAAFIAGKITGKMKPEKYLFTIGGVNTGNLLFSLAMLFASGKTRTGMAMSLSSMALSSGDLPFLLAAALLSAGISGFVTDAIAKKALGGAGRTDYSKLSGAAAVILAGIVFMASGFRGIALMAACAGISFYGILGGARRSNCMAFLMVPVLALYTGLV